MPDASMFAQTPSDALQCKISAAAFVKTAPLVGLITHNNRRDLLRFVAGVETYFWAAKTAQAVLEASASYPIEKRLYIPHLTHAFCVFSGPCLWIDIDGQKVPLGALSWSARRDPDGFEFMQFWGFVWRGAYTCPVITATWPYDTDKTDALEHAQDVGGDAESFAKFALTASAFVEQKIAVDSGALVIGKQAVKQAERAEVLATVKTIQLRATERHGYTAPDGESGQEYSCRWVVRGHWRKQYYPAAGRHVPLWIDPYIKGPEDKPLKAPLPEVFVVRR